LVAFHFSYIISSSPYFSVFDLCYPVCFLFFFFFFSSRRRHTTSKRDWSSDVCSSDLLNVEKSSVFSTFNPCSLATSLAFWITLLSSALALSALIELMLIKLINRNTLQNNTTFFIFPSPPLDSMLGKK